MRLNIFSFLFLLKRLYTSVLQNSLSELSQLINHNFNFLVDLNDSGNFISVGLKEDFFHNIKAYKKSQKLEISRPPYQFLFSFKPSAYSIRINIFVILLSGYIHQGAKHFFSKYCGRKLSFQFRNILFGDMLSYTKH